MAVSKSTVVIASAIGGTLTGLLYGAIGASFGGARKIGKGALWAGGIGTIIGLGFGAASAAALPEAASENGNGASSQLNAITFGAMRAGGPYRTL